jgi:CRISPR-associated protein Cmr1
MRKLPDEIRDLAAAVGVGLRQDGKLVTQTRTYKLITPLLGGGVESKENDPVKCVTAKGIRGQLRFWWRACKGASTFTSQRDILRNLKQREDALWGSASSSTSPSPSKVSLAVRILNQGFEDEPFILDQRNRPRPRPGTVVPSYGAFSLQPTEEERTKILNGQLQLRVVRIGVEFDLTLALATELTVEQMEEVDAALWCWETFGGVGGRTRRGFGALQLVKQDDQAVESPPLTKVEETIKQRLGEIIANGNWHDSVPHLSTNAGQLKVSRKQDQRADFTKNDGEAMQVTSAMKTWRHLVDGLQRFRQSPRTSTQYHGRSHWPEPDEIRRKTTHAAHRVPEHPVTDKFPRAAFGLPIIFKFKDEDVRQGDPPQTTLSGGSDYNRLASPLILRPLACANGEAVGIALILETPRTPPGGAILEGHGSVPIDLSPVEAGHIEPLKHISPIEPDVLKAFLKTV